MIFLHADLKLECTKLCKYIINIVERHLKNVVLSLPVTAFFHKPAASGIHIWTVLLLQPVPCITSLLRCKLRIAVYNVLEFIHHCSIRNKVDGILKMHLAVIIASFPEEKLDPWFRKEFHGHGMDFCCLHGQIPGVIGDRILAGYITLKCMSTLMCDYIHVTTGSVKVCKNKRYTIIRKLRHVTTGSLILTSEYIKKLILHHHVEEIPCLIRHLRVHFAAALKNLLRSTDRRRISLWEINTHIIITKCIYPKACLTVLVHSGS